MIRPGTNIRAVTAINAYHLWFEGAVDGGIDLVGGSMSMLRNVRASRGDYGIRLWESREITIARAQVADNTYAGIFCEACTNCTIVSSVAYNNGAGIQVWGWNYDVPAQGVVIAQTIVANNSGYGLVLDAEGNAGDYLGGVKDVAVLGLTTVHNGGAARLEGRNVLVMNLAAAANASPIETDLSNSTRHQEMTSILGSFFGAVTLDDPVNASDVMGVRSYPGITDWTSFATPWRTWGRDGGPGACSSNQLCRIYDWALHIGDSTLLGALPHPNGDDALSHVWSTRVAVNLMESAVELRGDGRGNDDAMCESGEACLYTPNHGSYQGHGDVVFVTGPTEGALEGILLYAATENGLTP